LPWQSTHIHVTPNGALRHVNAPVPCQNYGKKNFGPNSEQNFNPQTPATKIKATRDFNPRTAPEVVVVPECEYRASKDRKKDLWW
jgi:hypothetical protein